MFVVQAGQGSGGAGMLIKRCIKIFIADEGSLQNQVNEFQKSHPKLIPMELSLSECEASETLAVIFEERDV